MDDVCGYCFGVFLVSGRVVSGFEGEGVLESGVLGEFDDGLKEKVECEGLLVGGEMWGFVIEVGVGEGEGDEEGD